MKQIFGKLALCAGLFFTPLVSDATNFWKEVNPSKAPTQLQLIHPNEFKVYTVDLTQLRLKLWNLGDQPENGETITLPMPDGTSRDFNVWQTPMMPQTLADRYPDIRTFTATAVDNPTVGAKLDVTMYGFHAMIFTEEGTTFIDPFDNFNDGFYIVYDRSKLDKPVNERMQCEFHSENDQEAGGDAMTTTETGLPKLAQKTINGYELRTYRLALSCSHQYASAATGLSSPTKPQTLAKMTTTMNRVNGVYEREFSATMKFVANEDLLINVSTSGDPFGSINSNAGSCLSTSQSQCNSLIGSANYDIGHVFTTGSGGLASLGCLCLGSSKGQGTTGSLSPTGDPFDIDYVAHEMGHQFGSDHTFNNAANGSCAGGANANPAMSYEPGSGSTIMAYAGICSPDNVQARSDPYFHAASIDKILAKINGSGNCSVNTPTGNKLVKYNAFTPVLYNIPYNTPFELTAPTAVDSMSDSVVLYAWEQYDLGGADFGKTFALTTNVGPIFRSQKPSTSPVRVFPKISSVLIGNLNTAYEKVPTVARNMKFICLYRNIRNNKGCITIPDETITVKSNTTPTGAGFKVTSQNTGSITYTGGDTKTVTWDVVNTTASPVSTANVDIWMSTNGGTTWQYLVGTFPNNGSANVTIPNPPTTTTTARFKVKGSGNVFFNVNSNNFKVNYNSAIPITSSTGIQATTPHTNVVNVFPVPADDKCTVTTTVPSTVSVYNTVGQKVWQGNVQDKVEISVADWAKGMYVVRVTGLVNGEQTVKQLIVQ